jgi:FAD:protein FMN transferase
MKPNTNVSTKIRSQPLLGTFVEISVAAEEPDPILSAAFSVIREGESVFNFHDPESELSRLNASAGQGPFKPSTEMRKLLELCEDLNRRSGGLFDPTAFRRPDGSGAEMHGDWAGVELRADGTVRLAPGTRLNFSGIAKGYLVDSAVEAAIALGAHSILVNAGGDIRHAGEGGREIWVRDPALNGELRLWGTLSNRALATSAGYFSGSEQGSAYVNPKTNRALPSVPSVTVHAPTCALADGLTKVVLLGGAESPLLGQLNAGAAILEPAANSGEAGRP